MVDLGCGLGADLERYVDAVGPTGRAVGVDIDRTAVGDPQTLARTAGLPQVRGVAADIEAAYDMASPPRYVPHMVTSSDPDQQPSEATIEAGVEPRLVEDLHASPDHVLMTLVKMVNSLPSAEIGLTLYVGGSIVSGLLVSGHSHFSS